MNQLWRLINLLFAGNVEKDENSNEITIFVPQNADGEFSAIELMISMMAAADETKKKKEKQPPVEDKFTVNTGLLFSLLGNKDNDKPDNIYWNFYAPFFFALGESDHLETYCN